MSAFYRSLVLWATLAAAMKLLLQPTQMPAVVAGAGYLLCLPVAVALTWLAATVLPKSWFWRWPFWTLTVAGWLVTGLLLAGRIAAGPNSDDWQVLTFAALGSGVVALWLMARTRRSVLSEALQGLLPGVAIVVVLAGALSWAYQVRTRSLAAEAEARWAEIGLPMSEFQKTLTPIAENSGSQVVRQAFREILSQRFYKPGTGAAILEPVIPRPNAAVNLVAGARNIISVKLPPSDDLDVSKLPVDTIEPHAADLEETYRQILAAEPPKWACDPRDGARIDVPNFLAVRMFSQVASAESLRRLVAGDEDGAALPLETCEKLGTHLESNPTLVALMIHVTVDSLVASQEVRLAGADVDFETIGRDAAHWRESLVRSLQWDAWMMLHRTEDVAHDYVGDSAFNEDGEDWGILRSLPEWTRPFAAEVYMQRQCAVGALHNAEHAAICRSPRTRALRDLGARLHERVSSRDPSICDLNVSRVAKRIHATLLLREQVNLIRDSRARLMAGQNVESHNSAVLPRARWELTADPVEHTLSIRLTKAPKWVYEGEVAGADFWVLPLDGSVPWQFRAPEKTMAAR